MLDHSPRIFSASFLLLSSLELSETKVNHALLNSSLTSRLGPISRVIKQKRRRINDAGAYPRATSLGGRSAPACQRGERESERARERARAPRARNLMSLYLALSLALLLALALSPPTQLAEGRVARGQADAPRTISVKIFINCFWREKNTAQLLYNYFCGPFVL